MGYDANVGIGGHQKLSPKGSIEDDETVAIMFVAGCSRSRNFLACSFFEFTEFDALVRLGAKARVEIAPTVVGNGSTSSGWGCGYLSAGRGPGFPSAKLECQAF